MIPARQSVYLFRMATADANSDPVVAGTLTRRLVILANSLRRPPCRCIAGREVRSECQPAEFGNWVRPISDHGDGELFEQEIQLDDNSQPRALDVVDVAMNGPRPSHVQPDNWLLARPPVWRKIGRMARSHLALLIEEPATLWHLRGRRSDRLSAADAARMQIEQSLYLVRPHDLRVQLRSARHAETQSQKHSCRAVFRYHGVEYNLALADPVVDARFDQHFPQAGERAREERLPCGDDCLLCVSLAREYQGWHYKVAAAVLEL